jgi:hypothetical protein
MRYLDHALAWILLITAIAFILVMEITHLRNGSVLDVPFLWLVIAMMNFLRLRNSYAGVKGLRTFCIGANLIGLTLETVRFGLFGIAWFRYLGPYALVSYWAPYTVAAIAILGELIFSIAGKDGHSSATRI